MPLTASRARAGRGDDTSGPVAPTLLQRVAPWTLTVVVVVGVGFRFATRSPLWLDEALSVNIAARPLGEIGDALRRDGHPPLYYVLLHLWMRLFGDGDGAVRAMSGVFSVATLPLVWLGARRVGGKVAAAGALALVALSPYVVRYSTETRMYSLVMLLVAAGFLVLGPALERATTARLVAVALLTAALLYTNYWSIYLLAVVGLVVLWRLRDRATRPEAARVAGAMVAGGVLFLPWVPTFAYQAAHTGTPWGEPAFPTRTFTDTLVDLGGRGPEGVLLGTFVVVLLGIVALMGASGGPWRIELDLRTRPGVRAVAAVAWGTLLVGTLAGFLNGAAYATRYGAVVVPLVYVVAGAGLSRLEPRGVRAVLLCGAALLAIVGDVQHATGVRSQSRVIAQAIAENASPGDVVVVCPDQLGPALTRELRTDVQLLVYPTFGDPRFVDWVDYEERNARNDPEAFARQVLGRTPASAQLWLVWSPGYRTFEDQCEQLSSAFAAARPLYGAMVEDDAGTYFEHAWAFRYLYTGP